MTRKKVLLDTDIGSDIDDAVCLAWLLKEPACDLLGITTVTGQPGERASVASALLHAAGRTDIPIHVGSPDPIVSKNIQPMCPQAARLTGFPHQAGFEQGTALVFMREMIRAYPHEISLLAIGPMTNIGLLFAMDPELPSLLEGLYLMCGDFTQKTTSPGHMEWNAKGDPHAAERVYRARPRIHRSYGLDVTKQVVMDEKAFTARAEKDALLRVVRDFASVWFARSPVITFHDPLAAVCMVEPDICTYARGKVSVEYACEEKYGFTGFVKEEGGPHEVAVEVDAERFFDRYFGVFGA